MTARNLATSDSHTHVKLYGICFLLSYLFRHLHCAVHARQGVIGLADHL